MGNCNGECGDGCPKKNAQVFGGIMESPEDLQDPKKQEALKAKGIKPCEECGEQVLEVLGE